MDRFTSKSLLKSKTLWAILGTVASAYAPQIQAVTHVANGDLANAVQTVGTATFGVLAAISRVAANKVLHVKK